MDQLIQNDFKGVISIEQNRKWIYKQASGEADLANGRPNKLETKFPIASASQIFTAVGILKLVEQKKISLNDKVRDILEQNLGNVDPGVNIRHLLTHTSGIGDYREEVPRKQRSLVANHQQMSYAFLRNHVDFLPLFIHKPMQSQPGSKFIHSHSGYILLGLVIETVSGMPFEQFIEKVVFGPAGMIGTGFYALDKLPPSCATGYCFDSQTGEYYANIFCVEVKGNSAGGAYTTASDLENFWLALKDGALVGKPWVREMLNPKVPAGVSAYSYGLWLQEVCNDEGEYMPYIKGNQPGVAFISSLDKLKGRSITLLSNYASDVEGLHRKLYAQLTQ
ncbi:MAG: beta-lactamase family protein [Turicibacter sp.]|nr:beta-lactamase family protein [Turicibacter sp.]